MGDDLDRLTSLINESNQKVMQTISDNHLAQTQQLGEVKTSVAVLTSKFQDKVEDDEKKFEVIDDKFRRDYKRLNEIEKVKVRQNGVAEGKHESKVRLRYILTTASIVLAIVLSADKVYNKFFDPKPSVSVEQGVSK